MGLADISDSRRDCGELRAIQTPNLYVPNPDVSLSPFVARVRLLAYQAFVLIRIKQEHTPRSNHNASSSFPYLTLTNTPKPKQTQKKHNLISAIALSFLFVRRPLILILSGGVVDSIP